MAVVSVFHISIFHAGHHLVALRCIVGVSGKILLPRTTSVLTREQRKPEVEQTYCHHLITPVTQGAAKNVVDKYKDGIDKLRIIKLIQYWPFGHIS